MNERAAQRQLLLHAAGQFARWSRRERIEPGGAEQTIDAGVAFLPGLSEQAAEEIDILLHREARVEVASDALRHIGQASRHDVAMRARGHVAAKRADRS